MKSSIKKATILGYCSMPYIDSLKDNDVLVIVPGGIIVGTPVSDNEDGDIEFMQILNSKILEAANTINNSSESESSLPSDGFFTLKNATYRMGSYVENISIINVFYDQVVGITIGRKK